MGRPRRHNKWSKPVDLSKLSTTCPNHSNKDKPIDNGTVKSEVVPPPEPPRPCATKWPGVTLASKLSSRDDDQPPEPRVVRKAPVYPATVSRLAASSIRIGNDGISRTYASVVASHAEEYNASHPIPCTIGVSTTGANIETLYDDVLIPILDHVLVHYMPIPIDPLFRQVKSTNPYKERDPERHKRSTIDTSVLRASPRCLGIGYERYYALNTFVMDLSYFDKLRDTLSIWPDFPFISTALSQVKTLVLHGGPANNWKNAKKVLVEFQNLEVLILDTRSYCDNPYYDWARINYESAKDVKSEFPGVMNPLWHHETWAQVRTRQAKAKKTKDGGSTRRKIFHQSRGTWVVQPCAGKIKTMLLGAGVKVKDDCIMMADQNRLSTDSYHFTVDRLAYSIEEGIKRDKEIEEEKLYGKKVWKKPKIVKPDWHERAMARS